MSTCTCGRTAKGGPYPHVHAKDCAYVQPRTLEGFVAAGVAAQAAIDKLTARRPFLLTACFSTCDRCRHTRNAVELIAEEGRLRLCGECLDFVAAIARGDR